jgi:hypothetical protein
MKDGELGAPRRHPGHPDVLHQAEPGEQVSDIMAVPISLALTAPFIGAGANLGGDLLGSRVFNEPFDKILYP